MRTTASYELFPDAPSERAMARARWLAREGRVGDAERAYRDVLAAQPDLKQCWAEYFELLRRNGRRDDALRLADGCTAQFAEDAFSLTLRGAALIELSRYRDAITTLEQAMERDPDLAIAWHELGVAAYRLGDRTRAALALDRAFALEPHSETLLLRGRVMRDAGRYQAAEVAFEGAAQAAEHKEQRDAAEQEIAVTRRFAFYAPRKPEDLAPGERWFAEGGAPVLAAVPAETPPSDDALVAAFLELAQDCGWRFGQVVALGPSLPAWDRLAQGLGAPRVERAAFNLGACPLLVAVRPLGREAEWDTLGAALVEHAQGLAFVLEHPAETTAAADLVGVLTDAGLRRSLGPQVAHTLAEAQHPAARLAGRRLRPV
jgi:tetratricopeptide (TPR) repeat protein